MKYCNSTTRRICKCFGMTNGGSDVRDNICHNDNFFIMSFMLSRISCKACRKDKLRQSMVFGTLTWLYLVIRVFIKPWIFHYRCWTVGGINIRINEIMLLFGWKELYWNYVDYKKKSSVYFSPSSDYSTRCSNTIFRRLFKKQSWKIKCPYLCWLWDFPL